MVRRGKDKTKTIINFVVIYILSTSAKQCCQRRKFQCSCHIFVDRSATLDPTEVVFSKS
jgi:hypothetical protein